jgi:hypothetical protein
VAFVLSAVGLLAAVMVLSPVRSAGAHVLEQFRINQIRAVPFDPDVLNNLDQLAQEYADVVKIEAVDGVELGEAALAAVPVADIAAAADLTGFALRTPSGVAAPDEVRVEPGGMLRLHVDGARLRDLAAALGVDAASIPSEQGEILVETEPGVEAAFQTDRGWVYLRSVPAPRLTLPAAWDVDTLGELFLAGLGMSPRQAGAMSEAIDWGSTLVIPVPLGEAAAVDVRVDGVYGVGLEAGRTSARHAGEAGRMSAASHIVIWQKDGLVNAIAGTSSIEHLVAMADSLE